PHKSHQSGDFQIRPSPAPRSGPTAPSGTAPAPHKDGRPISCVFCHCRIWWHCGRNRWSCFTVVLEIAGNLIFIHCRSEANALARAAPLTAERDQMQGRSSRATAFVLPRDISAHLGLGAVLDGKNTIADAKPL